MSFKQLSATVREVYLNTRAELEGKDAEITALKASAQVAQLEAKVAELMERDARVKLFVDKLMAGKDVAAARISELEIKCAELELKCAELESRSAGLGDQLSLAMTDKIKLEGHIERLIDTTADLAAHNTDLAADFDDMESRASRAEDDNTQLVASVVRLESIVTAAEDELAQWKAAHAHVADRLAETVSHLQIWRHQADEMNAEKDAEIEELRSAVAAPQEEPVATGAPPTDEPASKKRRRGVGCLRREFTYDHVSVADGKLVFKIADAEHPATDAKLRYVDVITAAGRSYNRYYVVRDGAEKMCRSKAEVEREFGVTPSRKYSRNSVQA